MMIRSEEKIHNHSEGSMKPMYMLGMPLNILIEGAIHFTSLILPAIFLLKAISATSFWLTALWLFFAVYLYPFSILFLGALATRLFPKPKPGILSNPKDKLKYQTLLALNLFLRRTPARWLMNIPFPGILYYKLCGTKIGGGTLITFYDALQDPYLVTIGNNCVLGWGSLVFGHYAPAPNKLLIGEVSIGNNVMIGVEAVVWPNVKIGDGAIIQNKAVVKPGTVVPAGEIWGGIPAKKIRNTPKHDTIYKVQKTLT